MSSNTSVILTSGNYAEWARITEAKIRKGGAWGRIEGLYTHPGFDYKSTNPSELKLLNDYHNAEGLALGTIQESVDAANYALIATLDSKAAWEALKAEHNKKEPQRQFLLFQELANVVQKPSESLTAYHQRIELAAKRLEASFTDKDTTTTIIESIAAYFSLLGLEKVEENDALSLTLSVSGKVTLKEVASAYRTEQGRRDTVSLVQESGLAARAGRPPVKAKTQQKQCSHCGKAHNVSDCFKLHPEKMPDWMKTRREEQRKAKEAKSKAKETAAVAAAAASDSDDGEEAAKMTQEPRRV